MALSQRSFDFKDDDPYIEQLREMNAKGIGWPSMENSAEIRRRLALGFYNNFNDVDDDYDVSSAFAREVACRVSPSLVALSCTLDGGEKLHSSGIVVEYEEQNIKMVLSSSYIIGGHSGQGLMVDILLPDERKIVGSVSYVDLHHNVVLISADLLAISSARLCLDCVDLGVEVLSLGRHPKEGLMVSRGRVSIRNDNLESDDLMSSSCTISESGIGGPVVLQSGVVVGMNVYVNDKSSSFIPSCLLSHYLEHLLSCGKILRPWLGFKTRSLNEKKLVDLEAVCRKFSSTKGIFVTEVVKGSPADHTGIHVDDIITSCNDICLSSSVELADILLKLGKASFQVSTDGRKRKDTVIKVGIQRPAGCSMFEKYVKFERFTSPDVNRWPVIPLNISFIKCVPLSHIVQGGKRRSWQNPEYVGFLGSGSLTQRNGQLSKSTEPYNPPRQAENCEEFTHRSVKNRTGLNSGRHDLGVTNNHP